VDSKIIQKGEILMADMFRLDGKVAVVVGGGGGIGEVLALGMARQGAKIAIASRNLAKLEEVAKKIAEDEEVKKNNAEVVAFQVDVVDEKSVSSVVDQIVAKFGTVDILVNSQGQNVKRTAVDFPVEDWDFMFDVNVKGMMLCCKHFGKVMVEKKYGKIINISSVTALRGAPTNMGYGATKGAVNLLTMNLACEWAQHHINVNAIGPSVILTEMTLKKGMPRMEEQIIARTPYGQLETSEDLIGACVFLASPASDYVVGQTIYVCGGRSALM
jgi:NAD(P)-dependent dehydrogenase (short-subunit alcohol dehydrogenase family)